MSDSKSIAELAALRDAALEDLMNTTDEDLRREAAEDGENLDALASDVKSAMREAAAAALRQRMQRARSQMQPAVATSGVSKLRPSVDRIKQMVHDLFQRDSSLGLAFRDGKRQTEADWISLYDDLLRIGAIKSDDDEV